MKKFKGLDKAYGVNQKLANEGVWYEVEGSNLKFLVKPSTVHNKDFMKKAFEIDLTKKYGQGWENNILFDDELRKDLAKLYFGAVIVDYDFTDKEEKVEPLIEKDIIDLFLEYPVVMKDITNFAGQFSNFQTVDEAEAKN